MLISKNCHYLELVYQIQELSVYVELVLGLRGVFIIKVLNNSGKPGILQSMGSRRVRHD